MTTVLRPALLVAAGLALATTARADAPGSYNPRTAFGQSDADRSGAVDRRELYDRCVEVFYHADGDKDGFLAVEEVRKLPHVADLKGGDANGDGRLSVNEYVRVRDLEFEAADGDKNGELTVDEVVDAWRGEGQ